MFERDPSKLEPGDRPAGESLAEKAARLEGDEAQRLAETIANARMSTLQGAFRILGWPITFTVVEAGDDA